MFLLFLVVLLLFLVVGRGVVFVVWRGCVDLRCSELFRDFDNLGVSLAQLRPPFVWDAGARELGCGGEHENARVHGVVCDVELGNGGNGFPSVSEGRGRENGGILVFNSDASRTVCVGDPVRPFLGKIWDAKVLKDGFCRRQLTRRF